MDVFLSAIRAKRRIMRSILEDGILEHLKCFDKVEPAIRLNGRPADYESVPMVLQPIVFTILQDGVGAKWARYYGLK